MGLAHIDLRQFDKAEQLLKESLALARTVQDREGEARCVGDLGQLLARQSRWEEAEALLKEQLGLAEDIGARDLMGRAYGNLARVYRITRRDDEADAAHARAEQCFGRADSSSDQGPQSSVVNPQKEATMTAGDMDRFQEALALQNAGQLDEAIPLYEALIARCRRVENKEVLKISLGNLADLRLGRGEHATAEPLYRELINVSVELGDGNMARNAWLNLVVMPFREGKLQDAAHRLMQMLSWGTSQKDPQAVAMAKERLDALGINVTTVSDD